MDDSESDDYLDQAPSYRPPSRCYDIVLPKSPLPGEPERYRLPPAQSSRHDSCPPPEHVCFRFRTRLVSATGTPADANHLDVLKLRLDLSRTACLVIWLTTLLPRFASCWIKTLLPEWFLPPDVIIKREKADREAAIARELFDTEVQAYERLKDIQGLVVPICYGQALYGGQRALVLQDVGGVSLAEPAGATLDLEELSRLLQDCYHALHSFGVHQSDFQCGNFRLVGGRLVVLDLEMVEFDLSADDGAFFMATGISHLVSAYQRSRAVFRREGRLETA